MKLLLDTHALLWWLADDARLGPAARHLIEEPANDILVSTASLWEIAVKQRVGALDVDVDEVLAEVPRQGFRLLGIEAAHLRMLAGLPLHHRDPFDHLLIAQAIAEDATLVSADERATDYPVRLAPCAD